MGGTEFSGNRYASDSAFRQLNFHVLWSAPGPKETGRDNARGLGVKSNDGRGGDWAGCKRSKRRGCGNVQSVPAQHLDDDLTLGESPTGLS